MRILLDTCVPPGFYKDLPAKPGVDAYRAKFLGIDNIRNGRMLDIAETDHGVTHIPTFDKRMQNHTNSRVAILAVDQMRIHRLRQNLDAIAERLLSLSPWQDDTPALPPAPQEHVPRKRPTSRRHDAAEHPPPSSARMVTAHSPDTLSISRPCGTNAKPPAKPSSPRPAANFSQP